MIRRTWIAGLAMAVWMTQLVVAQEIEFEGLLDDTDQVTESEEMTGGDEKEFKVVTDDDISNLEIGDLYKNNTSYFEVTDISSKGPDGGTFVAKRNAGIQDPMRYWTRVSGIGPGTIVARETLFDRFVNGGPLMYPIAILLLAVIVIAVNSGLIYRREKQYPTRFVDEASQAIAGADVSRLSSLSDGQGGLLAAICRRMVVNFEESTEDDIRIRCEAEARKQIGFLRMPLRGLTFVAAVAPLLGLLGTVMGMIACFDSLASDAASAGKAQAMAAGIKVALLTTAFGLCVAVPALFVFFVYNLKLNAIVADCESTAMEFVHQLAKGKRKEA